MARKRRAFTAEFKDEAVKLVLERGLTITQAAQDVGQSTLGRWVQKARPNGPEEPLSWSEREELKRLRRENDRLREDREILKKAAAFFAKESR
ncbi:MAG: transposase [Kiritimatiellia bacterium]|jgi:transposase